MAKSEKNIEDVKRPNRVTPSATARPILVSAHPTVPTDPMMAPQENEKKDETETLSHVKAIVPLSEPPVAPVAAAKEPEDKQPEEALEETKTEPANTEVESESSEPPTFVVKGMSAEEERDPEAAQTAQEAALAEVKAKREAELETIITSGKYVVPINAVQRRRSHVTVTLLCIVAVLLALAVVDVVADAGVVSLPASVPHTHFFSKD